MFFEFDEEKSRYWKIVDNTSQDVAILSMVLNSEMVVASIRSSMFRGGYEDVIDKLEKASIRAGGDGTFSTEVKTVSNREWTILTVTVGSAYVVYCFSLYDHKLIELDSKVYSNSELNKLKFALTDLLCNLKDNGEIRGAIEIKYKGVTRKIGIPDGITFHETYSQAQAVFFDSNVYLSIRLEDKTEPLVEEITKQIKSAQLCNSDTVRFLTVQDDVGTHDEFVQYRIIRKGREYGSCLFVRNNVSADVVLTVYVYTQGMDPVEFLDSINYKELIQDG
ncbi:hypothetical protein [Acetivibrio ethanolgignens]|uniref:Uncharacterized protein n=1 Tax=Acetivibrio ethanolgignens TaxID=290052 RepID=A0A0V8QFJ9_9FIRM|nr:hypothetical protein [Acetivibrio ethanolgignens]KSV59171.1 hypothetical protein ASU35_10465 [Acetivibrio ethanolgignens]